MDFSGNIRLRLERHLHGYLLVFASLFLHFASLFLSPVLVILSSIVPPPTSSSVASNTTTARALVHVLTLLSRVSTASRKRELIRSLAEHLLNDNLVFNHKPVNHIALVEAFSQALGVLEAAVEDETPRERSSVITVALRYGMRRWKAEGEVENGLGAEELAEEMLWMLQKMVECDAVAEAVVMWGEAERLGQLALSAEPKLQIALLRLSGVVSFPLNLAFILNCTLTKFYIVLREFSVFVQASQEVDCCPLDDQPWTLSLLKSWLPLLCRVSNGVVAGIVGSITERGEMVRLLEEMIETLSCEEQEEVLSLWIQHFTVCADSDWPNLQSCYTRWYTHSRETLLLE